MNIRQAINIKVINFQKMVLNYVNHILILILVLFGIAGYFTYRSGAPLAQLKNAEQMIKVTDISDRLFTAMGKWANERGITFSALNFKLGVANEMQEVISSARKLSNPEFKWLSSELGRSNLLDKEGKAILSKIEDLRKKLTSLRFKADVAIIVEKGWKAVGLDNDFFDVYTSIIELAEKLQNRISSAAICDSEEIAKECAVLLSNIDLMRDVWEASEFAGRERAIISAGLAKGLQFPIETLERFRAKVEDAWKRIEEYMDKHADKLGAPVRSSFLQIEIEFFSNFKIVRDDIYKTDAGDGKQTISPLEWFNASSKAIKAFHGFSAAVSEDTKSFIKAMKKKKQEQLKGLKILVSLILIISLSMFALIFNRLWTMIKSALLVNKCHAIAGNLSRAVGSAARERGKTYMSLGSDDTEARKKNIDDILNARHEVSSNISEAMRMLDDKGIRFGGKDRIAINVESAYAKIQEERVAIDNDLISFSIPGDEELKSKWFDTVVEFTDHVSGLHLAILHHVAFQGNEGFDEEVSKLATLRHYLLEMGEFAGRERAIIGGVLVAKNIDEKRYRDISEYRQKADKAWDIARTILCRKCKDEECKTKPAPTFEYCHLEANKTEIPEDVRKAAANAVRSFFSEFTNIRENAHNQMLCYNNGKKVKKPIDPSDWFSEATKAIEGMINLANEVGKNIHKKTNKAEKKGMIQLIVLLLSFASGLYLVVWSFWLFAG